MSNGAKEGAAVLKYVDALDWKKRVEQGKRAWAAYHEFVAKMRAIEWDPMHVERTKLARQAA